MAKDGYKVVPSFWWDYEWVGKEFHHVIVESDHPKYELVARFHEDENATGDWGTFTPSVSAAEKLISDLNAGRITIKQAMEKYL